MQVAEGTIVAERFRLERQLGEGGMGAVWLARHLSLDVPCAVKFLHPEAASSADIRARFEQEAKAAAQLRSPHVVQILDHGVWEGMPYIAMELLDGEDLQARLLRVGRLAPRDTVLIASQVSRALGKAHAAGLVHRDLKPANIFLVHDEDREIVKVLDFGIAKRTQLAVGDAHTKTGAIMGSPHFMSPEQARGLREVDHRTDLWALGVVVFRCVVGRLPFDSDSLGDLFMLIMAEPLPVPSQLASVPPGFDAWWTRAAARDAAARFGSAKEMSDALQLALGVSVATNDLPASSVLLTGREPSAASDGVSQASLGVAVLGAAPSPTGVAAQTGAREGTNAAVTLASPSAPRRSSAVTIAAVLVGGVLLAGAGFAYTQRGGAAPAHAAPSAAVEPPPAPSPSAAPTAPPPVVSAAEPSAVPAAAPSASARPAPTPRAALVPAPTGAPRPRPAKPVHDDGI